MGDINVFVGTPSEKYILGLLNREKTDRLLAINLPLSPHTFSLLTFGLLTFGNPPRFAKGSGEKRKK